MKKCSLLHFAFVWLAAVPFAAAQSYSIESPSIISGGGVLSGGSYQMTGAIAAPQNRAAMSGGTYGVQGGLFGGYYALQTAGAPRLALTVPAAGMLRVVWPAAVPGWKVEQSATLAPASWTDSSGTPQVSGASQYLDVPASGSTFFVRLRKL
jgi:hypothetical protein